MQLHRDPSSPPAIAAGTVLSIGAYDGVHRGHRAVLRLVRELATARGLESAVVTFDRHPAEVVRPESAPLLLTTLDQKVELLADTGLVDHTVVLTFDESRSQEAADDFVHEVLVGICAAKLVVVGADFHFGHHRAGNVAMLEAVGAQLGFEVIGLGLVADSPGGPAYSSTRARHLLAAGDADGACEVLGRPHAVRGVVEEGDHRGRELGFPTANMAVPARICLPADGVYAGTVLTPDGREHLGAISLGRRPTFYDERGMRLLEPYLLDFDGDLYGHQLEVRFAHHLRPQLKFDGIDALIEQMHNDVERTRDLLG
ncbi:MAG TPA: bifunctional riboflavin kinase/FAD synthetase [Acidimicrobiia bacterium]|jgi:riboflavin kinase/FMN adenylyltransferase